MENQFPYIIIKANYDVSFRDAQATQFQQESVPHRTDQLQIFHNAEGRHRVTVNQEVFETEPGDVIMIGDWQILLVEALDRYAYHQLLQVSPQMPAGFFTGETDFLTIFRLAAYPGRNFLHLSPEQEETVSYLFGKYQSHHGWGFECLRFSTILELLVFFCRLFQEKIGNPATDEQLPLPMRAINLINLNCTQPISRLEIAEALGISERYLSKIFKEATGVTIKDYITRQRISTALYYLCDPRKSVQDAFEASGFSDYSNFFRMFRRLEGVSPAEYRRARLEVAARRDELFRRQKQQSSSPEPHPPEA